MQKLEGGEPMKRIAALLIALVLCASCSVCTAAARKEVVKDIFYIGAMRVVNCKDYVSLRETPDKTGTVLAKVPPDSIVLYCSKNIYKYAPAKYRKQAEMFIRCEYEGQEGYILKKYLRPAPECEPAETMEKTDKMTREEILSHGEVILDWTEFNVSVLATYEETVIDNESWEFVRVGCFINDMPNWGFTEAVKLNEKPVTMKAFMGGTDDEPMVYIYDEAYGLMMLDLMDGMEMWTILKEECEFGDAAVVKVRSDTGILYIAGTNGPDPIAVSSEGTILWRASINDPEVYEPTLITLTPSGIEVTYNSGRSVLLEYSGEVISVSDI